MAGTGARTTQLELSGRGVRFPPRWRTAVVPLGPPRATALATTLYTASRPLPWVAQNVLWALTRVGGARALPGEREDWDVPLDPATAETLMRDWSRLIGRAPDGVALYRRLQASRAVLTLLLCAGRDSLLVRVRRDVGALLLERRISELAAGSLGALRVPTLAGHGEVDGWHWSAFRAIATRPHRPVYHLPRGAVAEIASLVEAAVPRPAGTPADWAAAHLDVSPWNLRHAHGQTWLIDWEDAGWAPPGADVVYLAATVAAMGARRARPLAEVAAFPEAAAYWSAIVESRDVTAGETRLRERMLAVLASTPG